MGLCEEAESGKIKKRDRAAFLKFFAIQSLEWREAICGEEFTVDER